MSIVGGFDVHRKQLTFDYVDRATGELQRGQVAPADRRHLAVWLRRFDGVSDVEFAVEGCTGWRYVVEELQKAGVKAHLAEPADTAAARGRNKRAKTDRADSKLLPARRWPDSGVLDPAFPDTGAPGPVGALP